MKIPRTSSVKSPSDVFENVLLFLGPVSLWQCNSVGSTSLSIQCISDSCFGICSYDVNNWESSCLSKCLGQMPAIEILL